MGKNYIEKTLIGQNLKKKLFVEFCPKVCSKMQKMLLFFYYRGPFFWVPCTSTEWTYLSFMILVFTTVFIGGAVFCNLVGLIFAIMFWVVYFMYPKIPFSFWALSLLHTCIDMGNK